jgi:hypothetical protein
MPAFFGTEITGAEAFKVKLKLLEDACAKQAGKAIYQGVKEIAVRAKEILEEKNHVVTGNLRRSIQPIIGEISGGVIEGFAGSFMPGSKGFVNADAPYAPYVESLPDGGYLFPAYREKIEEVSKWIAQGILVEIAGIKRAK